MNTRQFRTVYTLLGCAILIAYPHFAIKYFETNAVLLILWDYLFVPISLLAILGFIFLYFKKVRHWAPLLKSKTKQLVRDIVTIMLGSFCCIMVANAFAFSVIITTNVHLGTPKPIMINTRVLDYHASRTKNGRLEHHIKFENPQTGEIISLTVSREYNVGEVFSKNMYIGYWGILYSKD